MPQISIKYLSVQNTIIKHFSPAANWLKLVSYGIYLSFPDYSAVGLPRFAKYLFLLPSQTDLHEKATADLFIFSGYTESTKLLDEWKSNFRLHGYVL